MPEGPELHLSSLFVNKICKSRIFSGKVEKSEVNWKNPEVPWDCPAYSIHAISRGKEVKLTLTELQKTPNQIPCNDKKAGKLPKIMSVLFRFGMSGCFKFGKIAERHKHAHLNFFTADGESVLSFVDVRRFGRWEVNADWSAERGPCVIYEYPAFRENVLRNLDKAAFNRPICEVLLNQSYFNGIGNYLRAEILYRLGIPPFACARDVLQPLANEDDTAEVTTDQKKTKIKQEIDQSDADLLQLCNKLPQEVVSLGGTAYTLETKDYSAFSDWLQCYYNPDMKNMVDHNGRTIWFHGPAGPLAPKENKSKKRKTKTKLEKGEKKENDSETEEPSNKKKRQEKSKESTKSAEGTPGTRRSKRSIQKKTYVESEETDTKIGRRRSTRVKAMQEVEINSQENQAEDQGKRTRRSQRSKNLIHVPEKEKVKQTKSRAAKVGSKSVKREEMSTEKKDPVRTTRSRRAAAKQRA